MEFNKDLTPNGGSLEQIAGFNSKFEKYLMVIDIRRT
jgi:hypothetical protein